MEPVSPELARIAGPSSNRIAGGRPYEDWRQKSLMAVQTPVFRPIAIPLSSSDRSQPTVYYSHQPHATTVRAAFPTPPLPPQKLMMVPVYSQSSQGAIPRYTCLMVMTQNPPARLSIPPSMLAVPVHPFGSSLMSPAGAVGYSVMRTVEPSSSSPPYHQLLMAQQKSKLRSKYFDSILGILAHPAPSADQLIALSGSLQEFRNNQGAILEANSKPLTAMLDGVLRQALQRALGPDALVQDALAIARLCEAINDARLWTSRMRKDACLTDLRTACQRVVEEAITSDEGRVLLNALDMMQITDSLRVPVLADERDRSLRFARTVLRSEIQDRRALTLYNQVIHWTLLSGTEVPSGWGRTVLNCHRKLTDADDYSYNLVAFQSLATAIAVAKSLGVSASGLRSHIRGILTRGIRWQLARHWGVRVHDILAKADPVLCRAIFDDEEICQLLGRILTQHISDVSNPKRNTRKSWLQVAESLLSYPAGLLVGQKVAQALRLHHSNKLASSSGDVVARAFWLHRLAAGLEGPIKQKHIEYARQYRSDVGDLPLGLARCIALTLDGAIKHSLSCKSPRNLQYAHELANTIEILDVFSRADMDQLRTEIPALEGRQVGLEGGWRPPSTSTTTFSIATKGVPTESESLYSTSSSSAAKHFTLDNGGERPSTKLQRPSPWEASPRGGWSPLTSYLSSSDGGIGAGQQIKTPSPPQTSSASVQSSSSLQVGGGGPSPLVLGLSSMDELLGASAAVSRPQPDVGSSMRKPESSVGHWR